MEGRSLKDLFHSLGRILPEEQELITVDPSTPVKDAISIMKEHNFTQIPIVTGNQVLGVFSYRSFAEGITGLYTKERDICELPVEGFCEDLKFAMISDELGTLMDELELKDAVLLGSEGTLQGVVTTIDALRYLYKVAGAYVMLGEIELAIRELIRASMGDQEIKEAIDKCLRNHYEERSSPLPTSLEEMTLSDCIVILSFRGFWEKFKGSFGGIYSVVQAKFKPLPALSNGTFHFRKPLTVEDYNTLKDVRNWLLKRIQKLEAGRKIDKSE